MNDTVKPIISEQALRDWLDGEIEMAHKEVIYTVESSPKIYGYRKGFRDALCEVRDYLNGVIL